MEPSILLLCKYGSFTVVLTMTRDFRFDDLVQSICKKWQDLVLQRFQLLYAVSDHHNCHLDNDDDFANMFALAGAYGVSCVDVGVEVLSSCSVESRELERTFDVGESSIVHGVEEDLLEKFCPHHETVRLSSGWAKLISYVGQEFRGGVDDFRSCLAKFAIEVGFVYTFLKNDKTGVTAVCSKKGESGCEWFIHATLNRANGFFRIKEFVKEHICVGVFASSKNPRMSSKLVAQEIREKVRSKKLYAPIQAVKFFEKYYGSKISYNHAWLGVEKAGLFPVIFGIVDSEDDENWLWFLRKLSGILSPRPITFITDWHSSLLKGIPEVFPNGHHAYCLQHLKNNLRDKLTGRLSNGFREQVISLFSDCAYAPTLLDFEEAIQELYTVGGAKAKNFVESLPRENWANAYFQGKRYGEMCLNAAESFNKWILEARHLPILSAIDKIRIQLMTQMCDRRQKSTKMNGIVCPEMDARLVEAFSKGKVWTVAQSSEEVFEVFSLPTVVVDLQNQRCTCSRWQINSFPCMHAITAIQKFGKQVTNYLDPFYFVDAYRFSYELSINPIPTLGAPNVLKEFRIILPPKTRRPRGRPKIQRIRSRGEKVRQTRCSRCKKLGKHNRKTCKEAVD
ncbi:hypothetical protein Vadar_000470 [Vaccinium darrowii]|uniref:Uncharacterized protein n=1 Tax=Vaccinium darrowii TaxID=229202 RepID=A0ACB7Z0M7_9ERIC|nr:hypothetical protein Vadar_000470 [Vaccinium darrowii]